jgi:hypothetical protein
MTTINRYQESEELRIESRSFCCDNIDENILLMFEMFTKG